MFNIAHRGGAGLMPENTIAAFRDAIERGIVQTRKKPMLIYGIELDVQLSSDGIAIVHHDLRLLPEATRKEGAWLLAPTRAIGEMTVAELQKFDVGRLMPQSVHALAHPRQQAQDGQKIPTLKEVLALAHAAALPPRLIIELKCKPDGDHIALADAALAAVEEYGLVEHSIFVGFDWRLEPRETEKFENPNMV
jgi:glycerophosphoryl diester phosphodiesterase